MPLRRARARHGLFLRLFGAGALIALIATGAATFATVRSTTVAVTEAQQRSLHDDARSYDALIGYAATHRSWDAAEPLVARLAAESDSRISVTDPGGRILVDSTDAQGHRTPSHARATLDPLNVDTTLVPDAAQQAEPMQPVAVPCEPRNSSCQGLVVFASPIDSRVIGPFRGEGEESALARLRARIDRCLTDAGLEPTKYLNTDFSVLVGYGDHHSTVTHCIDDSRRSMLSRFVAPRALLFVGDSSPHADVLWDLSRESWLRLGLLAGGVLAVTLLLSALLARRIVRPLSGMAATAVRAGDGDLSARVDYARHDEIGAVARAFNAMADRREQLEVARRRLVSDVSHELRTPVSNARAWLEGAQDGLVENDARLLASLHEEMLHLQHLIEDLHQLSLGDAGELRVHRDRVELRPFLDQLAESFRGPAEAAGVALVVEAERDAAVIADPVRLRQALGNLVANALRHTPTSGTVRLVGDRGMVRVADSGEGIPHDELPLVFERFHRVDASRSRASGGSGLGLAIVRQIAEAHGGTATIDSTPGTGTTVTLAFPDLDPTAAAPSR